MLMGSSLRVLGDAGTHEPALSILDSRIGAAQVGCGGPERFDFGAQQLKTGLELLNKLEISVRFLIDRHRALLAPARALSRFCRHLHHDSNKNVIMQEPDADRCARPTAYL